MKKLCGVYQIRNVLDNNIFIGSSANIVKAKSNLLANLRKNTCNNNLLQNAWNTFKEENFIFEILVECTEDLLVPNKQELLDTLEPKYNICLVSGSTEGHFHSDKTKEKISNTKHTPTEEFPVVNCTKCNKSFRLTKKGITKFEEDGLCSKCRNHILERKPCPECGNPILLSSKLCYKCANTGNKNPLYKDGWTTEDRRCSRCGESISHGSSGLCQKCYFDILAENRNSNYKDDHYTYLIYSTKEYINWRASIFSRDDRTCALCNIKDWKVEFNVHHIYPKRDFPELIFELSNGIVLCEKCHDKINRKEYEYIDKFNHILQERGITPLNIKIN
jgi:group I intron endonuclease